MSAQRQGIFCLEGDWNGLLTDRTSVEPALRMLENMRICSGVIHRDVATRDELRYYSRKWSQQQYARYSLGYFAFHGAPGAIQLGRDEVSLQELAELLGAHAEGRMLYLGSCQTLAASDEDLQLFCKATGVRAILGYTRQIDWITSAAFDFLLLPQVLRAGFVKPIFNRLYRDHPGFVTRLGFRIATADWTTERKIALDAGARR